MRIPRRLASTGIAIAMIAVTVVAAAPTQATPARAARVTSIPAPIRHGTLHIVGDLRDGGGAIAAGVSWQPPHLAPGLRLLTFQVAYRWGSCAPRIDKCVAAADTTTTPYAAGRYLVGHADVGRRLRVTEVATEVVQTAGPSFSFTLVRASVSFTTRAVMRNYAKGRTPRTEFVNGTPEARTASTEEYFQVDPPHYAGANGRPHLSYRIDAGAWKPLAPAHVFYTGKLAVGPHHVSVRTSNGAGTSVRSFAWQVVPMPAPQACVARVSQPCWYPPHLDNTHHPMRWDWQIGVSTPFERTGTRAVDIYDVDGFLTTAPQVHRIHTAWQAATLNHPKAICYLDLAWEDYRPDGSAPSRGGSFPRNTLGRIYYGYPQERWVDLRRLTALKPMIDARINMCARKGFDAIELDDIDSFEPPSTTGFDLTPGDAQNFLAYATNQIHRRGMAVLWKNTGLLSWWGRNYSDGAVVEECYVYDECFSSSLAGETHSGITCTALAGPRPCGWDDFSTDITTHYPTGKWVGEAEYGADHFVCDPGQTCPHKKAFATFCATDYAPSYGFSAVKFDVDLDGKTFFPCPKGV